MFEKAFGGRKHVFLVAIHVSTWEDATAEDVDVAHEEGADGVILIKDYTSRASDEHVLAAYDAARKAYPERWIGVNLLEYVASAALRTIRPDADGLWFDNAMINEVAGDTRFLKAVLESRNLTRYKTMLLPSIAFKYQLEEVHDVARVAKLAEPYADVLITSGVKTGVPADLDKVRTMREAVTCPIGLASGVSVDNVQQFIDLGVNAFIVNTSISGDDGLMLDRDKVRALRAKIPT